MSDANERNTNGTFTAGNSGGPGRPRRAIETEYLSALADAVTPERWQRIVESAAVSAEAGDDKARTWLSKYLLGDTPPTLFDLARRDVAGVSADAELQAQLTVDSLTLSERMFALGVVPEQTPFERAASAARTATDDDDNARLVRKVAKEIKASRLRTV